MNGADPKICTDVVHIDVDEISSFASEWGDCGFSCPKHGGQLKQHRRVRHIAEFSTITFGAHSGRSKIHVDTAPINMNTKITCIGR